MLQVLKKLILFLIIIFGLFLFTHIALAQWGTQFFGGKGEFLTMPQGGAAAIIVNVVMWMMSIIALLALGFIVYGAIMYVTSAGNEKQIELAKRILLYAIIGLVIAILAVVIIQLVARVMERGERPPETTCCICQSGTGDTLGCPEKLESKTCQDTCDYYGYSWATVQEISCTSCP